MELREDKESESEDDGEEVYDPNVECYIRKMTDFRDALFKGAKSNIADTQLKQKSNYDKKCGKSQVLA